MVECVQKNEMAEIKARQGMYTMVHSVSNEYRRRQNSNPHKSPIFGTVLPSRQSWQPSFFQKGDLD